MKKLLGIVVLGLLIFENVFAKEVIIVCKFENGNTYRTNGTVEKISKSTIITRDHIFKINENRKILIEIRPNREKIIKDVFWSEAAIKWYATYDFDPYMEWSHEINRFNGVYKLVASYDKEHNFYRDLKIKRQESFELCSTTNKLF